MRLFSAYPLWKEMCYLTRQEQENSACPSRLTISCWYLVQGIRFSKEHKLLRGLRRADAGGRSALLRTWPPGSQWELLNWTRLFWSFALKNKNDVLYRTLWLVKFRAQFFQLLITLLQVLWSLHLQEPLRSAPRDAHTVMFLMAHLCPTGIKAGRSARNILLLGVRETTHGLTQRALL